MLGIFTMDFRRMTSVFLLLFHSLFSYLLFEFSGLKFFSLALLICHFIFALPVYKAEMLMEHHLIL